MTGLTAASMLCSEIIVRSWSLCNNAQTSSSGPVTNHFKFKSLNITFAVVMILRVLANTYLNQYYAPYIAMACMGALQALGLLMLLATNKQAKAHIGARLRNRLAGTWLEPNMVFLVEVSTLLNRMSVS